MFKGRWLIQDSGTPGRLDQSSFRIVRSPSDHGQKNSTEKVSGRRMLIGHPQSCLDCDGDRTYFTLIGAEGTSERMGRTTAHGLGYRQRPCSGVFELRLSFTCFRSQLGVVGCVIIWSFPCHTDAVFFPSIMVLTHLQRRETSRDPGPLELFVTCIGEFEHAVDLCRILGFRSVESYFLTLF